jgi:hypothetical protein
MTTALAHPPPGDRIRVTVAVPVTPQTTLEHHGWSTLRPDHPARHGQDTAAFVRMIGLWWGDLLSSLRAHAARHR